MNIQIDAKGKQCPLPVIEAKNAISGMTEAGIVEVTVDNEIAVQNLTKMADHKGLKAKSEKKSDQEYTVWMEVTEEFVKNNIKDGNVSSTPVTGENCIPDIRKKKTVVVLGADHIGAVADADARERAVGRVEGVVIGRKTRHGDLAADGEVLHILGGGDVAVDEDAGDIAVLVADHDGLNKAVFKLEALDEAAEGDETAENGAVVHLRGGDLRRDDGLALADLRDGGDLQLQLTLIEVGRAAHADAVADLEVPGDGEAVDAAGAVLNIDAVEEGGILVIAGGVRGDDALDRVLVAGLGLLLHLGDRGDLHGIELLDEVLADAVVGVVLFSVGIFTPYYGVGIRCMA